MIFYLIALIILLVDQLFKFMVQESMRLGQTVPLLGNALKLTYVRNTGAAFSLFVGFSPYLVVAGILVAAAVIYFHYRVPKGNFILQAGLAFVLGGSLGNLVDRIFRSYVIDYIDITVWPVFNFADVMINLGVILIAFKLFEKEKEDVPGPV
jgi:signal peptidase II